MEKPTWVKENKEGKKPDYKVRAADVSAAVWLNTSEKGLEYISCRIERVYTDESGEKKNTQNLGLGDLPKAIACLEAVYCKYGLKEES